MSSINKFGKSRADLLTNKIDGIDEIFKNSLELLQQEINLSFKTSILKSIEKI